MFQSTHPRGVRQAPAHLKPAPPSCFNPRTRVGCDTPFVGNVRPSIGFQSTHPRGVRRGHADAALLDGRVVSIHAPAWGATYGGTSGRSWTRCFNPRTRVGCDLRVAKRNAPLWGFNPRTRVGCDIFLIRRPAIIISFNPRTRVGCDFSPLMTLAR